MPMTFKKLRFKFPRLSLFAAGLALAVAPALGSAQGTAESGAATSGVFPTVVTWGDNLPPVPPPGLPPKAGRRRDEQSGPILAGKNPKQKPNKQERGQGRKKDR